MEVNLLNRPALNVVKASNALLPILVTFFLVFGCTNPSTRDIEKLHEVEKRFGDRYVIKFEGEFYVTVQPKVDPVPVESDVQEICKIFRFKDFNKREERNSSYVYFNAYDSKGRFLYQLYYDPQTKAFAKSKTPHY
jgi:hypothetical protein